jgi:hypothetical protein
MILYTSPIGNESFASVGKSEVVAVVVVAVVVVVVEEEEEEEEDEDEVVVGEVRLRSADAGGDAVVDDELIPTFAVWRLDPEGFFGGGGGISVFKLLLLLLLLLFVSCCCC